MAAGRDHPARNTSASDEFGEGLLLFTDLCLCEYTGHGHCGVLNDGRSNGQAPSVDNDRTLDLYRKIAVSQAEAGTDFVAPSGMMDGQVGAIRSALDSAGHHQVVILAYSAKFASAFYGPFREVAESAPQHGDRRGYQMDWRNVTEALRELEVDVAEGADIVMVKPALAYLDVLQAARSRMPVPRAAYDVSGEYAMVEAAAARGWIDRERAMLEVLTSIRRAGASIIVTYFAKEAAAWVQGQ